MKYSQKPHSHQLTKNEHEWCPTGKLKVSHDLILTDNAQILSNNSYDITTGFPGYPRHKHDLE